MKQYEIKVPDAGRVDTYVVSDRDYDIEIIPITNESIQKSGSKAFAEMVQVTNAIAHGHITFKNEKPGGIKRLDELIKIVKELRNGKVAFYIVRYI